MTETITSLLLIQLISVGIIDVSGFIQDMEATLSKWLNIKAHIPKPFSCSTCCSFWAGIIYLLCTGNLTLLTTAIVLMIALFTTVTSGLIFLARDIIIKIITKINSFFI